MNYQSEIDKIQKQLEELNSKTKIFNITRLISFIITFLFIIFANAYNNIYILVSFISLPLFILIVKKHNVHEMKLTNLRNKIIVLKNYLLRQNNQFHTFVNDGSKYIEEEKFYLSDLDIFGTSSLFQLINVCETKLAQDLLAKKLKTTNDKYLNDVSCVEELKNKIDYSVNFQSNNYGYSRDLSKVSLESSLEQLKVVPNRNLFLEIILPILVVIITITSIVYSIITKNISYFLAIIILNFVISLMYSQKRRENFISIQEIVKSLSPLASNFAITSVESFNTPRLQEIQKDIKNGKISIDNLKKIETLVSLQSNFLSSIILNALIPYNIIVYNLYIKFHSKSNVNIKSSIDSYVYLETLLSLAIIPQIKKEVCIPKNNSKQLIEFIDLKHPLIKEEDCVSNTLNIKPSVNIITGSNMSGKTSFLRTIGINLVLMYAGGMVNSKEFNADTINIYSSMRITDDIKNGISTFYRELLRIKTAIVDANNNVKSIIFIDEVFRGTNSNDRIEGAVSLINNLKLDNVILFMTTHDFELCKVKSVNNYHFEEHYIDDKIKFDYKLKEGMCTTTNAKYLMKLSGIIK